MATTQGEIDTSKLPKYAQRALDNYARQVRTLQARIDALENTEDDTGTRARMGSLAWYSLPKHQTYEFDLALGSVQVYLREEHDGWWLAISAVNCELECRPRASNLIYVRGAER